MNPVAVVMIEAATAISVPMNPRTRFEAAGAGGQVRDDQDGGDSDRGGADAAKQLSGEKDRDIGREGK
jgi:hypothetical protein